MKEQQYQYLFEQAKRGIESLVHTYNSLNGVSQANMKNKHYPQHSEYYSGKSDGFMEASFQAEAILYTLKLLETIEKDTAKEKANAEGRNNG